ncbi:MAG: BrnT family toxin [Bacteriovoracaceae bacterium]|nr:BrnT family toxin [Bacteriovoracaceae bacterium]
MRIEDKLKDCIGFDWDHGNGEKNWIKHQVTQIESEQVFLNGPVIAESTDQELKEIRFLALGMTNKNRSLTVIFTVRKNLIRVISARNMSKKERSFYEQKENT